MIEKGVAGKVAVDASKTPEPFYASSSTRGCVRLRSGHHALAGLRGVLSDSALVQAWFKRSHEDTKTKIAREHSIEFACLFAISIESLALKRGGGGLSASEQSILRSIVADHFREL